MNVVAQSWTWTPEVPVHSDNTNTTWYYLYASNVTNGYCYLNDNNGFDQTMTTKWKVQNSKGNGFPGDTNDNNGFSLTSNNDKMFKVTAPSGFGSSASVSSNASVGTGNDYNLAVNGNENGYAFVRSKKENSKNRNVDVSNTPSETSGLSINKEVTSKVFQFFSESQKTAYDNYIAKYNELKALNESLTDDEKAKLTEATLTNLANLLAQEVTMANATQYIADATALVEKINADKSYIAVAKVAAGKYSTFAAPFDVTIASGIEAYTIENVEGTVAHLTKVEGNTIVQNTPVILFNTTSDDYQESFTGKMGTDEATVSGNSLVGYIRVAATDVVAAGNYVLQTQNGVQAFYKVDADNIAAAQNRCFLTGSVQSNSKYITFSFNQATDAATVKADVKSTAPIYDLLGNVVKTLIKGNVYIQNGNKFIQK